MKLIFLYLMQIVLTAKRNRLLRRHLTEEMKVIGDFGRGSPTGVVRRGRARGLGCTLITQRPAVIREAVALRPELPLGPGELGLCGRERGISGRQIEGVRSTLAVSKDECHSAGLARPQLQLHLEGSAGIQSGACASGQPFSEETSRRTQRAAASNELSAVSRIRVRRGGRAPECHRLGKFGVVAVTRQQHLPVGALEQRAPFGVRPAERRAGVGQVDDERRTQLFRFWPETGRTDALRAIVSDEDFIDARPVRATPDGRMVVYYGRPITGEAGENALHALDLDTGKILWSKQMIEKDAYTAACRLPDKTNCADSNGPDFDFGASPILIPLASGRRMLVAGKPADGTPGPNSVSELINL